MAKPETAATNQGGGEPSSEAGRRRLRRLSESPIAEDRARAAVTAAEGLEPGDGDLDEMLGNLANDEAPRVREVAAAALARVMRKASGFVRLSLLADWAGRPSERQRLALARALRGRATTVGAPSALETLAGDDSAAMREAAYRAAAKKPHWFDRVLRRGRRDDAPSARRAAERAAEGLSS